MTDDGGRFSPAAPGTAVLDFGVPAVLGVTVFGITVFSVVVAAAVLCFAVLRLGVPVRGMRGRRRRRWGR
jgi:hypothetical protein